MPGRARLLKLFCSATSFKKSFFMRPLMNSLDVNDTCNRPVTNLKNTLSMTKSYKCTIHESNYTVINYHVMETVRRKINTIQFVEVIKQD